MDLNKQQFTTEIAGQTLKLEISRIAERANAAVLAQYGETLVLVTATMSKEDRLVDFLPLVIDYEEKFYAAGKIIGSRFIRREGRPSDEAVLSGRLIDRSLRPFFDSRLRRDIQIIITVLSYDEENDPDFTALLAASIALGISDIPFNGPVAGVRLARFSDGKTLINPKNSQIKNVPDLSFEAFVSGVSEKISMIELAGNEAKEEEIIESFPLACQEIKKLIEFQKDIIKKIRQPKIDYNFEESEEDHQLKEKVQEFLKDKLESTVYTAEKDRQNEITLLKKSFKDYLNQEGLGNINFSKVDVFFEEEIDKLVHNKIIELEQRPDGRRLDELRPLYVEVGLFKRLHGSALFVRGNTQALAVATLAAPGAEQLIETMEISAKRRFMLHYNFPPSCVGEVGRLGPPGRREISHGALVEKALRCLIPSQEEFPYTIRVVSEILSSNGSSSMASVCASSMALMDAGVPIKKAAAGIAMGLMMEKQATSDKRQAKYKILTDIQGTEDHHGDMDFKVAGTSDGVTAIQMDVKIDGITIEILKDVLSQAKKARLEILEFINKAIDKPRPNVSQYAPVIITLDIKPEQIGEVIGPAGKVINNIIATTGVESIDIEQTGRVFVASHDAAKAKAAVQQIQAMTRDFQVGEIVSGKVIKILEFGAIVDLGGGKDGMIHISELKEGFVQKVEDILRVGDMIKAKIIKVENGRIGLSLKAVNK